MPEEILKMTKITFIFQASVSIAFGLVFLFGELFVGIVRWPYYDPVFMRLTGMNYIGMAVLMLLSSGVKEWTKVENVVIMVIFWTILNSIVLIILQFLRYWPLINWIIIGSYMLFAVLFIIVCIKQQK